MDFSRKKHLLFFIVVSLWPRASDSAVCRWVKDSKETAMECANGVLINAKDFRDGVGKCLSCHGSYPELPVSLRDRGSILLRLESIGDGTLDEMIRRARFTSAEKNAVEEFVRLSRDKQLPARSAANETQTAACFSQPSDDARILSTIPKIQSETSRLALVLEKATASGKMIFYDRATVPRTWQSDAIAGALPLLYSSKHRTNMFMYKESGYFSDAGTEFPWLTTAGLDSSRNGFADRFVIPGELPFIRLVSRTRSNSPAYFGISVNVNGPNMGWTYSEGTVFGEVLKVSGIPFEIRLRSKKGTAWEMDVLRPFASPADLAAGIRKVCSGEKAPVGCARVNREPFLKQIRNPATKVTSRSELINARDFQTPLDPLLINSTAAEATLLKAKLHELPDFPDDVRFALLTKTPFKSVFGKPWIGGDLPSWAPTCRTQNCIVPQNYFAAFIPMTQASCMKCHDSTGRQVDHFSPLATQMFAPSIRHFNSPRSRTWYGHVPGDDGIFSFHPFRASAIAKAATASDDSINQCLVKNNLLLPREITSK